MYIRKKLSILLMIIILALSLSVVQAYASDSSEAEVGNSIFELYSIIRAISIPLAVVGVTGCGVQMLTNQSPEGIAKAKRAIIIILVAEAAILLLPTMLQSGKDVIGTGWDPNNPG